MPMNPINKNNTDTTNEFHKPQWQKNYIRTKLYFHHLYLNKLRNPNLGKLQIKSNKSK